MPALQEERRGINLLYGYVPHKMMLYRILVNNIVFFFNMLFHFPKYFKIKKMNQKSKNNTSLKKKNIIKPRLICAMGCAEIEFFFLKIISPLFFIDFIVNKIFAMQLLGNSINNHICISNCFHCSPDKVSTNVFAFSFQVFYCQCHTCSEIQ